MKTFYICLFLFGFSFHLTAADSSRLIPFQGRLTDASGRPIPDGVRPVQFQIFDAPSGGNAVWIGETHRTTVNGGLINVVLGTKTSLTSVDFNRTLYLEMVAGADGAGQIAPEDPPLLPRQAILPVIFATESAMSRDSQKLAGYDWNALFGTNNPSGRMDGSKVANITSNSISPGTINASLIARETINSNQIAAGGIAFSNLAPRSSATNSAGAGAVAVSLPSGEWVSPTPGQATQVPNLTVSIRATGRPVIVFLNSGGSTDLADNLNTSRRISYLGGARGISANIVVLLFRDGKEIANEFFQTDGSFVRVSPGSVHFMDIPPSRPEPYVYSIRVGGQTASSVDVANVVLVAYEL